MRQDFFCCVETMIKQARNVLILNRRLSSFMVLFMLLLDYPDISVGYVSNFTNMIPLRGSTHNSKREAKKQTKISNDFKSLTTNEGKKGQKKADKEITFFDENDMKTEGTISAMDDVVFENQSLSPSSVPNMNLSIKPTIATQSISPSLTIETSDFNSKQIKKMPSPYPTIHNFFDSSLYPSSTPMMKYSNQPSISLSLYPSSLTRKFSNQPSMYIPLHSTSSPSSKRLSVVPSISPTQMKLFKNLTVGEIISCRIENK